MAEEDEHQDGTDQEHDGEEWVRVVAERPVIDVVGAAGGWPCPWPNVAELAGALPADRWTLIGGLMAQMHAINRGIDAVRPTSDVDIVLHIETERGTPRATVAALERIGYQMLTSIDPLNPTAHRFIRGTSRVDVIAGDTAMEANEDQTPGIGRHLNDAAVLLACIEDPFDERHGCTGSDRSRLLFLQGHLSDDQAAWRRMPREDARRAQQVLRILCAD